MIKNRNIMKEENKVLNDIIKYHMFTLTENQKTEIEKAEYLKEALDVLDEIMINYGITFHADIDEFISEYIAEKYNIDENEEILMYIDSKSYFENVYMCTQSNTVYFHVENTLQYVEVWGNF